MGDQCIQNKMIAPQRRNVLNSLLFPANLTGLGHIGIFTVCFLLLTGVRNLGMIATRGNKWCPVLF